MRRTLTIATLIVAALAAAVAWAPDEIRAALLGVGTGSLVAALALGVVLTYKGSGVINFAGGAMATYSAYAYDALRRDGSVFLPPLPSGFGFDGPLAFWPALVVTLVLSALLGLACHALVFRPLRAAPPLMKVVASVGVLITLQALVVLRFGSATRPALPVFDKRPVDLPGGITVPSDQLVLCGIVLALAALLWALLRFTRFGLATRAAAENERGAVLLGFSPDALAAANWMLSTVVMGLLGVLVATVNGSVDPGSITLLIVPALGAALIGGFTSFGVTTAAALAVAMAQNLVQYVSTLDGFPQTRSGPIPGLREAVPLLVIVVVLFARGDALPRRGAVSAGRLPAAPLPANVTRWAVAATAACLLGLLALGPEWRLGITNSLVGMVACLSLVVLTGYVGQISLAQMAIAGVSGFTLAKVAASAGVPFPLAPLAGAVAAAFVGVLVGLPALRIRGVNLAIVTFAAAVTIESLVFRNPAWSGGAAGAGAVVPSPHLGGLRFGPNDPGGFGLVGYASDGKLPNPWFGVFCLLVVLAVAAFVVNLRRSAVGRRMLAIRSNERAAAAAGISITATKLTAFGISAFIAGLAGALSGYRFGSVSPEFFGGFASLTLLAFAFLGGVTSVSGAALGGVLIGGGFGFVVLERVVGVGDRYTVLIGGLGLLVNAVLNPEGIAGAYRQIAQRLRATVAARAGGAT